MKNCKLEIKKKNEMIIFKKIWMKRKNKTKLRNN